MEETAQGVGHVGLLLIVQHGADLVKVLVVYQIAFLQEFAVQVQDALGVRDVAAVLVHVVREVHRFGRLLGVHLVLVVYRSRARSSRPFRASTLNYVLGIHAL